ncbi:MAG: hypothetical protein ACF788_13255 [Novipirellula sp. JB048]
MFRPSFFAMACSLLLFSSLALVGCGGGESASSPDSDQLQQYLQDNPEAAERTGEPAGVSGDIPLPE